MITDPDLIKRLNEAKTQQPAVVTDQSLIEKLNAAKAQVQELETPEVATATAAAPTTVAQPKAAPVTQPKAAPVTQPKAAPTPMSDSEREAKARITAIETLGTGSFGKAAAGKKTGFLEGAKDVLNEISPVGSFIGSVLTGDPLYATKEAQADFAMKRDRLYSTLRDEGFTDPEEANRIAQDAGKEYAWTTEDEDRVRQLSKGELVVNPSRVFGQDLNATKQDIEAANATPDQKAAALRSVEFLRQRMSDQLEQDLYYSDPAFRTAADNWQGDKQSLVDFYTTTQKNRNFFSKSLDATINGLRTGGIGVAGTVVGTGAGLAALTGAEGMAGSLGGAAETLRQTTESQQKALEQRGVTGAPALFGDIANTVTQMAPMLIGGAYARGLEGLSQAAVGGASVYGWSAAQGYSSKLDDAIAMRKEELGRDLTEQEMVQTLSDGDTQIAAFANGIQTAALSKILGGGAERAAIGAIDDLTVRDFLSRGGREALMDAGFRTEMKAIGRRILGDAADESVEEGLNQVLDSAISASLLGKEVMFGDLVQETFTAAAMGGLVGGVLPQVRKSQSLVTPAVKDTAPQAAQAALNTPVTGFEPLQGQAGVIGLDGKPIPMSGTAPEPEPEPAKAAIPEVQKVENKGRAKMAERILASAGVDPESASVIGQRLAQAVDPDGTMETEAFRQGVLAEFSAQGGSSESDVQVFSEIPESYAGTDQYGRTPEEQAAYAAELNEQTRQERLRVNRTLAQAPAPAPAAPAPAPAAPAPAPAAPAPTANQTAATASEQKILEDAAYAEANTWDMANRGKRSDEWFDGGNADADAIQGYRDSEAAGGMQLQAHGMAKESTLSGGVRNLLGLLRSGLDPNRRGGKLDTAPLVIDAESAKAGAGGITASGTAYRDGPFTLVARPGQNLSGDLSGLGAVVINQANAAQAEAIKVAILAVRPDVLVGTVSELGDITKKLFSQETASAQAAPTAPAPAPAPTPLTPTQQDNATTTGNIEPDNQQEYQPTGEGGTPAETGGGDSTVQGEAQTGTGTVTPVQPTLTTTETEIVVTNANDITDPVVVEQIKAKAAQDKKAVTLQVTDKQTQQFYRDNGFLDTGNGGFIFLPEGTTLTAEQLGEMADIDAEKAGVAAMIGRAFALTQQRVLTGREAPTPEPEPEPSADTDAPLKFADIEFVDNPLSDEPTGKASRESGKTQVANVDGRKIVLVEIDGVNVPFYLSTGKAGKKNVAAKKWYPILGMDIDGWLNKGSEAEINNYYGSEKLKAAALKLDQTLGTDTPAVNVSSKAIHESVNKGLAAIGITPTANNEPLTRRRVEANKAKLLTFLGELPASAAPEPTADETPQMPDFGDIENESFYDAVKSLELSGSDANGENWQAHGTDQESSVLSILEDGPKTSNGSAFFTGSITGSSVGGVNTKINAKYLIVGKKGTKIRTKDEIAGVVVNPQPSESNAAYERRLSDVREKLEPLGHTVFTPREYANYVSTNASSPAPTQRRPSITLEKGRQVETGIGQRLRTPKTPAPEPTPAPVEAPIKLRGTSSKARTAAEDIRETLGVPLDPDFEKEIELDSGVTVEIDSFGDFVTLTGLKTPKESRGKGLATQALKEIVSLAGDAGVPIRIVAEPFGTDGMNKAQLIDWYSKNGFALQADGETMIYTPAVRFSVDDKLIMRSTFTNEDAEVSFRGYEGDKAMVWTGRTQMAVPVEWLRRPTDPAPAPVEAPAAPVEAPAAPEVKLTPIEKRALAISKLKGTELRANGITYVPEKVMTLQRRKSLLTEEEKAKPFLPSPRGGPNIEVKEWAEVTGDPYARGWAIIDRRKPAPTPEPAPTPTPAPESAQAAPENKWSTIDAITDPADKGLRLEGIASNRFKYKATDQDLIDVLDRLDEATMGSQAWRVAYAVAQNPAASPETKARAETLRENWMRPGRMEAVEPEIGSTPEPTPTTPPKLKVDVFSGREIAAFNSRQLPEGWTSKDKTTLVDPNGKEWTMGNVTDETFTLSDGDASFSFTKTTTEGLPQGRTRVDVLTRGASKLGKVIEVNDVSDTAVIEIDGVPTTYRSDLKVSNWERIEGDVEVQKFRKRSISRAQRIFEESPLFINLKSEGGVMSMTFAKKLKGKKWFEANKSQWDGTKNLPQDPRFTSFFTSSEFASTPDVLADNLYNEGKLPSSSPNSLWDEIVKEIASARKTAATEKEIAQNLEQDEDFARATSDGKYRLILEKLSEGDVLFIDGEEVIVDKIIRNRNGQLIRIDFDGGNRFGNPTIKAEDEFLYVDDYFDNYELIPDEGIEDEAIYGVDFALESVTQEQLDEEAAAQNQRDQIAERQAQRLTGGAGDLTADMFGEGDTSLFNERRDTERFQSDLTAEDEAYFDAIDRGDTETAQAMVDEAARAAGYDLERYHITPATFTIFRTPSEFTDEAGMQRLKATYPSENSMRVFIRAERVGEISGNLADDKAAVLRFAQDNNLDAVTVGSNWGDLDDIIVINPNQIKSADPIVKDDNGDIIPPSQRFNPLSQDIRYQRRRRRQKAKGLAKLLEDGKVLLKGLLNPDFTTAVHEMAHAFEMTGYTGLTDEEVTTLKTWAGDKNPNDRKMMGRTASEKFARGWERYLADGKAPFAELQAIFDKMQKWMLETYKTITGSPIDVEISPEVRAIFDKIAARMVAPSTIVTPSGSMLTTEDGSPLSPAVDPATIETIETDDQLVGVARFYLENPLPPPPALTQRVFNTPEDEPLLYSLQRARADMEAALYGYDTAAWNQAARTFKELWDRVINEPEGTGEAELNKLMMSGNPDRPLSYLEVARFTHEGLVRKRVLNRALEQLQTAISSGDQKMVEETQNLVNAASARYQTMLNQIARSRTAAGRALNAWKYALQEDFSQGTLYSRALVNYNSVRVAEGKPAADALPEAEAKAVAQFAERMAKMQEEIDALKEAQQLGTDRAAEQQAMIDALRAERDAVKSKKSSKVQEVTRRVLVDKVRKAAKEARERLGLPPLDNNIRYQMDSSNDPTWYDRVIVLAEVLVANPLMSTAQFADRVRVLFGAAYAAVSGNLRNDVEEYLRPMTEDVSGEEMPTPQMVMESIDGSEELTNKMVYDLAKAHVYDGARDTQVITNVFNDLQEFYPSLTREDVAQLFTRYGETQKMDASKEAKALRAAKSLELVQRQIDDLEARGVMQRTGTKKDDPDVKLRELRKKRDDLAKDLGYVPVDPETQLSSPQTAAMKRMKNEIEELEKAIAEGKPRIRVKRGVDYTPSMEEMRSNLEELRKAYADIFGQERTPAERMNAVIKDLDRRIAKERDLINKGILKEEVSQPAALDSPEISARRERLKELKRQKVEAYDLANPGLRAAEVALKEAQRITKSWINKLAASQSDTPTWRSSAKPSAVEELIKSHIENPRPDFAQRLISLGATAEQARILDSEIRSEVERRRIVADARNSPQEREARILRDLDRRIEAEKKLIDQGLIKPKKSVAYVIDSAEISARRERLKELKRQKYEAYDALHPNERALNQAMKAAQKALEARQKIINEGLPAAKDKPARDANVTPTAELEALWEAADDMDVLIREMRKNRPLTPAQQLRQLDDAYDVAVQTREKLKKRIADGDLVPASGVKPTVEARTRLVREENVELRKQITQMQRDAGVGVFAYDVREAKKVAALEKSIEELRRKRSIKDFSKRKTTEPVTSERIRTLELIKDNERREYEQARAMAVFKTLGLSSKALEYAMASWHARQLFNLAGDFGVFNRQLGKMQLFALWQDVKSIFRKGRGFKLADDTIIGKTLAKGFEAFMDEKVEDRIYSEMATDPSYALKKANGFDLVSPHESSHEISADGRVRVNPMFLFNDRVIASLAIIKGIVKTGAAVALLPMTGGATWKTILKGAGETVVSTALAVGGARFAKRVERANRVIINVARWGLVDAAMKIAGNVDPSVNPDYSRIVTEAMMTYTGKVAGQSGFSKGMKNNSYWLGIIFSFPQYVVTNMQSVVGIPLWSAIYQSAAKRPEGQAFRPQAIAAVAALQAQYYLGTSAKILFWAMLLGVWDEEDTETEFGVVLNPKHPYFGCLKLGKTFIDLNPRANKWISDLSRMFGTTKLNERALKDGYLIPDESSSYDKTEMLQKFAYSQINMNWKTLADLSIKGELYKGGELGRMGALQSTDVILTEIAANLTARDVQKMYEVHGPVTGSVLSGMIMGGANVSVRETESERGMRKAEERRRYKPEYQ